MSVELGSEMFSSFIRFSFVRRDLSATLNGLTETEWRDLSGKDTKERFSNES